LFLDAARLHRRQLLLRDDPDMNPAERTTWIARHARDLGFDLCGVAKVGDWPELARLPEWLAQGYAGEMKYLHDARRGSPAQVLPGVRSVIVCALNYNTSHPYSTEAAAAQHASDAPRGWISRYAWGDDYHDVLGTKLETLSDAMRGHFPEPHNTKWYVDTGPVSERVAAQRAGLGSLAKNTLLINPKLGSWLFLGVILTTLDFAATSAAVLPWPDVESAARDLSWTDENETPAPDLCGQCTLCIDACPTGAIVEPYMLDARRCISYLTIELRGAIPEELRSPMGRQVFGCDICQDVCPWNRKAPVTLEPRLAAREKGFAPELEWLAALTEDEFRDVARGSPLKRAKWRGLVRNACVALGNSGLRPPSPAYARVITLLGRLADSPDAIIAEHATWALSKLRSPA
jgi:epoxyqueuosine reductase